MSLHGKSVLLVDDVAFVRKRQAKLLSDMGAAQVSQAGNGREALDTLNDGANVDLIISDFNMPVLHGLQLLRAVRGGESKAPRDLTFAVITGHTEKYLVDIALKLDVNAFLIKPVSKRSLERRINSVLENIDSEDWLKAPEVYKAFDVDDALNAEPKMAEPDSTDARELAKADPSSAYECSIFDLPKDAVLARDVVTSDGNRYLKSGQTLTPRITALLVDLNQLGHPVETVWIEAECD